MQCKGTIAASNLGSARWFLLKRLEGETDTFQSEIISTRYNVAEDIAARITARRSAVKPLTDRIDQWALHPVWGGPLMLLVFGTMFYLTFTVSRPVSKWITDAFDVLGVVLTAWFTEWNVPGLLAGLIVGGILKGVAAAMGFLLQMARVFFSIHLWVHGRSCFWRI